MAICLLDVQLFPVPEGMSLMTIASDPEALEAWIKSLPQSAFILVLVAHLSQAFFG